jgi:hypothetical protein
MRVLLLLILIFALTFANVNTGNYIVEGLYIAKNILKASSLSFFIVSFEEVTNAGASVRKVVSIPTFPDFSIGVVNGTDILSASVQLANNDGTKANVTASVLYTSPGINYNGLTIPANSVKTQYVLDWPAPSAVDNKFILHCQANWTIGATDALSFLDGISWQYIDENGVHVGLEVTKPFFLNIYFPSKVTVDGTAATFAVNAALSANYVDVTVTLNKAGQLVDVDPVVTMDPNDTQNSATAVFYSFALLCILLISTMV